MELGPVLGTTPPRIPRAVPLPPALPVTTVTFPWADTRDAKVRARMKMLGSMVTGRMGQRWDRIRKD